MANAEREYFEKRRQQIQRRQKIVTYISLLGFGGSILFGGFSSIQQAWQQPQQPVVQAEETELEKQVKGYELVLQREPNNQVALEKLSVIKLQAGDNQGAIALLERLVKLHPDRKDYQTVLADAKKTENNNQVAK